MLCKGLLGFHEVLQGSLKGSFAGSFGRTSSRVGYRNSYMGLGIERFLEFAMMFTRTLKP